LIHVFFRGYGYWIGLDDHLNVSNNYNPSAVFRLTERDERAYRHTKTLPLDICILKPSLEHPDCEFLRMKQSGSFFREVAAENCIFGIDGSKPMVLTIAEPCKPYTEPEKDAGIGKDQEAKPWLLPCPDDPKPPQSWYIPARYFARELVKKDSTLLQKKDLLAGKVAKLLSDVGIYKRGGKSPLNPATVKKAFSNISFG
jgi:hypothetical protein